jgi:hypothetical protein
MILGLFVDDVIGIFPQIMNKEWEETRAAIFRKFTAKDLGDANFILGMRVSRDRQQRYLYLDQQAYINKIVNRFSVDSGRTVSTPISDRPSSLDRPLTDSARAQAQQYPFRELIGSLLYAAISTRPDIAYSVTALAQQTVDYGSAHYDQALRALRYLSLTSGHRLRLGGGSGSGSAAVKVYTDADWAGDKADAKSMSGAIILLGDGAVHWTAKKQSQVSLSSMESEYVAMVIGVQDALWLHSLLAELRHSQQQPATLYVDNQSAITYCHTGGDQHRTRHVNIRYHFVRDHIQHQSVIVKWIDSDSQLADLFTKPLYRSVFQRHRDRLLAVIPSASPTPSSSSA